jgi:hypothetical protein
MKDYWNLLNACGEVQDSCKVNEMKAKKKKKKKKRLDAFKGRANTRK